MEMWLNASPEKKSTTATMHGPHSEMYILFGAAMEDTIKPTILVAASIFFPLWCGRIEKWWIRPSVVVPFLFFLSVFFLFLNFSKLRRSVLESIVTSDKSTIIRK